MMIIGEATIFKLTRISRVVLVRYPHHNYSQKHPLLISVDYGLIIYYTDSVD